MTACFRSFPRCAAPAVKAAVRAFLAALSALALCASMAGCSARSGIEGLADGAYAIELSLEGGSGRASVSSPATVTAQDGALTLTLTWSSSNYDKMVVDGAEYAPVSTDGGSTFEIPVSSLDEDLAVQAETTAMGEPHLIDYTLRFDASTLQPAEDGSGAQTAEETEEEASAEMGANIADFHDTDLGNGWQPTGSLELSSAKNFTVDEYEGGYRLICIASGERFLVVPEDASVPDGLAEGIAVIQLPLDDVYLVSSSVACLVDAIGAMDAVAVSGIEADDCSVESLRAAMEAGDVAFGGKYNMPDYELITDRGCTLAIENTMVNHAPEVREKLQALGVTVLTEQSSRESSALGRLEWIKLFGVIFDREDEAKAVFEEQARSVEAVASEASTGKTVAFFYVNSNGAAVVRSSGDYVPQMIELAGGRYIFDDIGGSSSTVTLEMEQFYLTAKDADCIVYNRTIDGSVSSIEDLVAKNPLLEQFAAVRNGDVWTTNQDMYQQMTNTAAIVADLHAMLAGDKGARFTYLTKLD